MLEAVDVVVGTASAVMFNTWSLESDNSKRADELILVQHYVFR